MFKQGAGQQTSGASQKPGRTDPQAKGKHMFKNIEDVQTFGKEQMETVTATATTLTKGMQEIAAQTSDYSKKSFEATQGLVEKMIGVKSIDKAFELQTEFSKQAYEGFVAQSTKVADLYTSLVKEAFKPVEAAFAKVQAAA
jgi:phasin family protein